MIISELNARALIGERLSSKSNEDKFYFIVTGISLGDYLYTAFSRDTDAKVADHTVSILDMLRHLKSGDVYIVGCKWTNSTELEWKTATKVY